MSILSTGFVVCLAAGQLCIGSNLPTAAEGQASIMGVRPTSVSVAELVAEGRDRSPTFRSLLEDVNVSGWIVFVQKGSCRLPGVRACLLHRVGMFHGRRYLRIVLSGPPSAREEMIATIGHELQHAAEVVTDRGIENAADISELYRRVGYLSMRTAHGQLYETTAAVRTGGKILQELRRERGAAAATRGAPLDEQVGYMPISEHDPCRKSGLGARRLVHLTRARRSHRTCSTCRSGRAQLRCGSMKLCLAPAAIVERGPRTTYLPTAGRVLEGHPDLDRPPNRNGLAGTATTRWDALWRRPIFLGLVALFSVDGSCDARLVQCESRLR